MNATVRRRKRQTGVEWEHASPVVWDDLEPVRRLLEAELGPLDVNGRFMGDGANKNLAKMMRGIIISSEEEALE